MDDSRFDALARSFVLRSSRRFALAAAVVALGTRRSSTAAAAPDGTCKRDRQCGRNRRCVHQTWNEYGHPIADGCCPTEQVFSLCPVDRIRAGVCRAEPKDAPNFCCPPAAICGRVCCFNHRIGAFGICGIDPATQERSCVMPEPGIECFLDDKTGQFICRPRIPFGVMPVRRANGWGSRRR